MRFWWDAVNNSKCRNEKDARKRQFCDLLLKICVIFGKEINAQKRIEICVGRGGKDSSAI